MRRRDAQPIMSQLRRTREDPAEHDGYHWEARLERQVSSLLILSLIGDRGLSGKFQFSMWSRGEQR